MNRSTKQRPPLTAYSLFVVFLNSLAGGGDVGPVDLIHVPEPTSVLLLALGAVLAVIATGRFMVVGQP